VAGRQSSQAVVQVLEEKAAAVPSYFLAHVHMLMSFAIAVHVQFSLFSLILSHYHSTKVVTSSSLNPSMNEQICD
jgi:hypothetical protein